MELLAQVPAGAYTVRNLTAGTQATVTVPTLTASITQASAIVGATLTLTTNASARSTYQWRRNGTNIAGATANTLNTTSVSPGSIDCVVTSGLQSVTTAAITLSAAVTRSITALGSSLRNASNNTGAISMDANFTASAGDRLLFAINTSRTASPGDTLGITSATIGGQALTSRVQRASNRSASIWEVTLSADVTPTTQMVLNWAAGVERLRYHIEAFRVVGFGAIVTTADVSDSTAPTTITANVPANAGLIAVKTAGGDNSAETVTGATLVSRLNIAGDLFTTTATATELAAATPHTVEFSQAWGNSATVLVVLPPL